MDEKSPLEKLNNGCLDYIFLFLEMPDVVHLNLVSNCFQDSTKHWIRKREIIDYCELTKDLADVTIRGLLAIYGEDIRRVGTSGENEFNDLLPEYCSNIEYMRVACGPKAMEMGSWASFIGRMKSLCSLFIDVEPSLFSIVYSDELPPDDIDEIIAKLHNLECLRIHNARISGSGLIELTKLKELDLTNCDSVRSDYFINAFQANPNLTKINIFGCGLLDSTVYRRMAEDTRHIESLTFEADLLNGECIPGLNHLKHLTIYGVGSFFGDILLREYSNACGETLTSLTCYFWEDFSFPEDVIFPNLIEFSEYYGNSTDVALRSLCNSCPRLEKVKALGIIDDSQDVASQDALLDFFRQSKSVVFANLEIWHCFSVSLYKEIVDIRRTFSSPKTLRLVVYGERQNTEYEEINSFMKGNEYAALREFVEIEFENK